MYKSVKATVKTDGIHLVYQLDEGEDGVTSTDRIIDASAVTCTDEEVKKIVSSHLDVDPTLVEVVKEETASEEEPTPSEN